MRTIYIEFALLSLLIVFLQIEALLCQVQPTEVGVEMPEFVIREGVFHGKVQFIFKGDSAEELNVISLRICSSNGILPEKDIFKKFVACACTGSDTYGMVDFLLMEGLSFIEPYIYQRYTCIAEKEEIR